MMGCRVHRLRSSLCHVWWGLRVHWCAASPMTDLCRSSLLSECQSHAVRASQASARPCWERIRPLLPDVGIPFLSVARSGQRESKAKLRVWISIIE